VVVRGNILLFKNIHEMTPKCIVDPYPAEVAATVDQVMALLGYSNPYRLVWQSQVGPSAWLGPKTEQAIESYAKQGKKELLVVPIAFVSDHIETLFELDLEYGELAQKAGIGYKRIESLNDDPEFIEAMADLVKNHMESQQVATSSQFKLRCPMCTNETCGHTKDYFHSQFYSKMEQLEEDSNEESRESKQSMAASN
jgi:ferrochelatase